MTKYSSNKQSAVAKPRSDKAGGTFADRDLTKVNPLKEQFEPTDSQPVRQHYKMAGGC